MHVFESVSRTQETLGDKNMQESLRKSKEEDEKLP